MIMAGWPPKNVHIETDLWGIPIVYCALILRINSTFFAAGMRMCHALFSGPHNISIEGNNLCYRQEFTTITEIAAAMKAQEDIGWYQFLLGQISKYWKRICAKENYQNNKDNWLSEVEGAILSMGV